MLDAVPPSYWSDRPDVAARLLLWIACRRRDTGEVAPVGLWTGADDITIDIGGAERVYYGGGAILEVEPIRSTSDLSVQIQRFTLSALSPAVEVALRAREPRLAPLELHSLHYDPVTRAPLGVDLHWKGTIDRLTIETPAEGGTASAQVFAASSTRALTRGLTAKRSHENQARRNGDAFFKYAAVGLVKVWWGQKAP